MLRMKFSIGSLLLAGIIAVAPYPPQHVSAQEKASPQLSAGEFANLQEMIKPQPGELRWMDVVWFLDLHEARQKAAAEGKPLFILSSGGATGIGSC